jgi:hypothetical protein
LLLQPPLLAASGSLGAARILVRQFPPGGHHGWEGRVTQARLSSGSLSGINAASDVQNSTYKD